MKIVVAMSGGVDSSVAAALLQKEGHEVQGVFMKNWSPLDGQSLTDCPWEVDQADAEAVCNHLGIPFRSVNFERQYREKVVDNLVSEYAASRTPNPDVLCNKEIKFSAFWEVAKELGAEAIATGHYVRLENGELLRGVDPGKDQSYFLYSLTGEQLSHALFPIGKYPKPEVRKLAEEFGLPTASKKDSQGICFIGHLNLKDFLEGELGSQPGELKLLPKGGGNLAERMANAVVVGEHRGAAFYTTGERMGGYLDNRLYSKARGETDVKHTYVVSKDALSNTVYVTDDHDDSDLFSQVIFLESSYVCGGSGEVSLVDITSQIPVEELTAQLRYHQQPLGVKRVAYEADKVVVELSEAAWAASPGQSLVLYRGDRVLGGGVVCATR